MPASDADVRSGPAVRGFLLHLSHYDPRWCAAKATEPGPDADVAGEVLDAMAAAGLNTLVLDCADGVVYASHPELARPYSAPMDRLRSLVARAQSLGIDVVPKLNFSQSPIHRHNDWFRPHNELFDSEEYWRLAFEIIDELIETCRPGRYFHVGMDEDHSRSHRQYVAAIETLHAGLAERGLRTVIWNDSSACQFPAADVHAEKSEVAEKQAPAEVIHVVWDYRRTPAEAMRRVAGAGLELWVGPGRTVERVVEARDELVRLGGSGVLMTRWVPCTPEHRDELLEQIATLGPLCG